MISCACAFAHVRLRAHPHPQSHFITLTPPSSIACACAFAHVRPRAHPHPQSHFITLILNNTIVTKKCSFNYCSCRRKPCTCFHIVICCLEIFQHLPHMTLWAAFCSTLTIHIVTSAFIPRADVLMLYFTRIPVLMLYFARIPGI